MKGNPLLRFLTFLIVIMLALTLAPMADAQSDKLIVAGQRIGPIQIGMLMDDVDRLLGSPVRSRLDESIPERRTIRNQYEDGIYVDFLDAPAPWACAIYVDTPDWQTPAGLRVGDTGFDMARKEGTNYRYVGSHVNYNNGLEVDLNENKQVIEIWIGGCTG
jgi:hypothetical protein